MSGGNGTLVKAERRSVMGELAERYSMDPAKLLDTIKATCIKGNATNEQTQAFMIVAKHYDLDPFLKEIYAFPDKGGGIVPIVSIDGWAKLAKRGGMKKATFRLDGEGENLSCTAIVETTDGREIEVTEYLAECKRGTPTWQSHKRRMLRHRAYIQACRYLFGLAGIYDEDE